MITTYKCKGCGAPIEFDGNAGELVCEFCDTHMTVEEAKNSNSLFENVYEDVTTTEEQKIDVDGYKCQSCGAELITDADTTATVCTFCGSSAVLKGRFTGETMPAKIVPFAVTKDKAKEEFKKWCKKGIFTPSMFKKNTFIEKIQGIYVPFWLFDYSAGCSIDAKATKVHTHRQGDYIVKKTEHYRVYRDGEANFDLIPADASEKMPDEMMDLLEPYDYSKLTDFQMPYLSGFLSEKYNYDANEMAPRVEKRVKKYIHEEVRNTIRGYSSVIETYSQLRLRKQKVTYTLLPVWMITYRYNNENCMLAINGQNGKQVGKLPKSVGKMWAWFGGISAASFAVLMLLGGIFG